MTKTKEEQELIDSTKELETEDTKLPEAPMSTHIDAYFKGFHVGFTIRSNDNEMVPAVRVTKVVNTLIEKGYEPSWNTQTSKEHLNPTPVTPQVDSKPYDSSDPIMDATSGQPSALPAQQICPLHNTYFVLRQGISKTTNKPYSFYACPGKNPDGSFCRAKPGQIQRGV